MFKFTNYVMMFAPIGVGAAMAHTIGTQGPSVLVNLGKLIFSLYLALIIFVIVVFGIVIVIARIPLRQFFRAVREPAALAFATTSSESALPKAMESMERFGAPPSIVGFAGVPRAALVILLGTLNSFMPAGLGPIGVAVIFGVDELMDMGRTAVNVVGNCLATVVVARWEKEFDEKRACVFGTPQEAELDLKSGDVAFADAVRQGD
jgi:proton glutamate symport protein